MSLSPGASHFLFQLGALDRVIAVDPASAALPPLRTVDIVSPDAVFALEPDLVFCPPETPADFTDEWREQGAEVVAFAPGNLEDVYNMFRGVGARVVGHAEALRREVAVARPLAAIGGESFGERRLRTLAITRLIPLEVAGAHSFETDLIELAGAESVTHTHGGKAARLAANPDVIEAYAPELILVMTPSPLTTVERGHLREHLGSFEPVDFLTINPRNLWHDEANETARNVRSLIARRTQALSRGERY